MTEILEINKEKIRSIRFQTKSVEWVLIDTKKPDTFILVNNDHGTPYTTSSEGLNRMFGDDISKLLKEERYD